MRTVALVGGAEETREGWRQSSADEFWLMNWAYRGDWIPRIDRLFEMHPVWLYSKTDKPEWEKPRAHWKWLTAGPKSFPIYMLADLPQVPSCVRYPIEAVTEDIFGDRLLRGQKPSDFYSSSFDYMMALAIHERWDVIEIYGVEMGSTTEYRYQREGSAFFIGQAVARGITVIRPENSVILRGRRYGYEGGQMIFRQDLERMLWKYKEINLEAMAHLQHWEGVAHGILDNGNDPDKMQSAQEKIQHYRDEALMSDANIQLLNYQIRHIDLEEVDLDVQQPIKSLKLEGADGS